MLSLKLAFVLCIALLTPAIGTADTIVVPNANTNSPGNSPGNFPTTPTSLSVQVLYEANQFSGPVEITGLSSRAAPGTGPVSETVGSLTVYLAYSPNFPNSTDGPLMSTTFADNIGADNTLVFSGTNITISDAGCSGPGVCPFDMTTNLTTPFYYNPADGNLLEELVATNFSGIGQPDAVEFDPPGGSVARLTALGTSATTGTLGYGNSVIEFIVTPVTPVPEPPSLWMMAVSMVALFWTIKKQRSGIMTE